MFNNLLESKPKKEKRGGGTVTSVVVHSILVGLAVYATANAAIKTLMRGPVAGAVITRPPRPARGF